MAPLLPALNSRLFFAPDGAIEGGQSVQSISLYPRQTAHLSLKNGQTQPKSAEDGPNSRISPKDTASAGIGKGLIACARPPNSQQGFLCLGSNQCIGDFTGGVNQQRRGQHTRPLNPQRWTGILRENRKFYVQGRCL